MSGGAADFFTETRVTADMNISPMLSIAEERTPRDPVMIATTNLAMERKMPVPSDSIAALIFFASFAFFLSM